MQVEVAARSSAAAGPSALGSCLLGGCPGWRHQGQQENRQQGRQALLTWILRCVEGGKNFRVRDPLPGENLFANPRHLLTDTQPLAVA